MSELTYDKLGFCVLCHREIGKDKKFTSEDGLDSFNAIVWYPERRRTEFKLENGSKLITEMCKDCNEGLEEKDYSKIMYSAMRGQEEEIRKAQWPMDRKKKYIEQFRTLKIIGRV